MNCALKLISKSMQINLSFIEKDLHAVGISQSMNGIENHLTKWVQAFAAYVEAEDTHIRLLIDGSLVLDSDNQVLPDILFFLTQIQENVMDKVSETMNVIYEEVEGGILIPRVRNHIIKELTSLSVTFSDYSDLVEVLSICNDETKCNEKFIENTSDESVWLKTWIMENSVI